MTAFTTDLGLFRRLHVVNGALVLLCMHSKQHMAQLVMNPDGLDRDLNNSEPNQVILSPLLAFNMGITDLTQDQAEPSRMVRLG